MSERKIKNPEILWSLAEEYFEEIDNNPFYKNQLITGGDMAGCIIRVPTIRPYTWAGLEMYVFEQGYNTSLDEYKSNRKGYYDDYSNVITRIGTKMYAQKFEGAAVGAFNPNIISSDLGLVQKTLTEIKDTTDDIDYDSLSESALEEINNARSKANN